MKHLTLVLVSILLLFSAAVIAGEMSYDAQAAVYAKARALYLHDHPAAQLSTSPPAVAYLPMDAMRAVAGPAGAWCYPSHNCVIYGLASGSELIILCNCLDFDSPYARTVYAHEAIHTLQYAEAHKKKWDTCLEAARAEVEAYQLQTEYMLTLRVNMAVLQAQNQYINFYQHMCDAK